MFGMVVDELNRLWMQQQRTPSLIANPEFRSVWEYILHYANESLLEKPVGSTMKIGNTLITHIPRSLSANLKPKEDGCINSNDISYWTKYAAILIQYWPPTHFIWRGYVEWDVSVISQNATIMDTAFKYHGRSHVVDAHIHEMLGARPSISSAHEIWDEAGEGTVYADPDGFPEVGTGKQVDLGASAVSDLQSQLSAGWFAIGLQSDNEGAGGYETSIHHEEWAVANPPPTLYLEYELPGPPTLPGSVLTESQTISSGSRHIEIPYYPYRIELRTRTVMRHITRTLRG